MKIWSAFTWPKTLKARLFLAIFVVLIIGLGLWLIYRPQTIPKKPAPLKLGEILRQNKHLSEDDDKDGLKNWEEQIYQTDPQNADTDGDHTNDGDEITQGRDPIKKGPDDKIEIKPEESGNKEKTTNLTDQFTDAFIREPVTQIIAGGKPNINTDLVDAYADQLLSKSILDSAPKINESILKKELVNSLENIQNYLQNFERIWKNNIDPLEKELDIAITAFQKQDYSDLPKLEKNVAAYQKTIDEIKLLPAPASIWNFHVEILNFLYKIKLSAELMKEAEKDPLKAMLAIKDRLDLNNKLNLFLKESQEKITKEIKESVSKTK